MIAFLIAFVLLLCVVFGLRQPAAKKEPMSRTAARRKSVKFRDSVKQRVYSTKSGKIIGPDAIVEINDLNPS